MSTSLETSVRERYAAAAEEREVALCCPVSYDPQFLAMIPQEILEKDYGCGDPSKHLLPGDTVLDLGSGGGKICYIAAQIVGSAGRVIGVDFNEPMLELARKYQPVIAKQLGFSNVEFRRGRIQDLQLDLDLLEQKLGSHPVRTARDWLSIEETIEGLRSVFPLVASSSVDVVVSNCVLNLVRQADRDQLFDEIFRVLKPGGRAVISDIVACSDVPERLQRDAALWSGCISGAFREDLFGRAFEAAGFVGVEIVDRQAEPWQVIEGIEFRSLTLRAYKPLEITDSHDVCEVIYRGPWAVVIDDTGTELPRGERVPVTDSQRAQLALPPYGSHLIWADEGTTETSSDECCRPDSSTGGCCSPASNLVTLAPDLGCCTLPIAPLTVR